jgi:hypothetical protein
MAEHSILVGKSYRTPEDEVRDVTSIDNGEVVYRSARFVLTPTRRGRQPSPSGAKKFDTWATSASGIHSPRKMSTKVRT